MSVEELRAQIARYAACADALPAGAERTTTMLGIMCVLAAAAGQLVAMPPEWGWLHPAEGRDA